MRFDLAAFVAACAVCLLVIAAGFAAFALWERHRASVAAHEDDGDRLVQGLELLAATANIERVRPTVQPTVYIAPSPLLPTTGRHRRQTIGERHRPLWAVDSRDWPTSPAPRPALTGMAWATSCELWEMAS